MERDRQTWWERRGRKWGKKRKTWKQGDATGRRSVAVRSRVSCGMSSQEVDSEVTHGDRENGSSLELMAKSGWERRGRKVGGITSAADQKCRCGCDWGWTAELLLRRLYLEVSLSCSGFVITSAVMILVRLLFFLNALNVPKFQKKRNKSWPPPDLWARLGTSTTRAKALGSGN